MMCTASHPSSNLPNMQGSFHVQTSLKPVGIWLPSVSPHIPTTAYHTSDIQPLAHTKTLGCLITESLQEEGLTANYAVSVTSPLVSTTRATVPNCTDPCLLKIPCLSCSCRRTPKGPTKHIHARMNMPNLKPLGVLCGFLRHQMPSVDSTRCPETHFGSPTPASTHPCETRPL